jgi:hypothetical protein
VHEDVPVRSQFTSPELIEAIVYAGHDPAGDPRWRESGAPSRAEYGRYCIHWCGMACLAMILTHRDGTSPGLYQLFTGCAAAGGYQEQPDGTLRGLIYQPFAGYVADAFGLRARVHRDLPVTALRDRLAAGDLVIASVHKEIRRPDLAPRGKGGHLVLVTGYDGDLVHLRNPSGHTGSARSAVLPAATFAGFYAERGISVNLAQPC